MKKTVFTMLCLLAIGSGYSQVTIYKNCRIVSSRTPNLSDVRSIVVEKGKIIGIKSGNDFQSKDVPDSCVIDLKGMFVIPGLIDAHVHLSTSRYSSREERIRMLNKRLSNLLHSGVTSVRDVGGDSRILQELQGASALNEIPSPYIYFCSFMAGSKYYEESGRGEAGVAGFGRPYAPWQQLITPETNLDEAMLLAKGSGATGIKIYAAIDGNLLTKMVAAAKRHGLRVWSHSTLYPARPSDAIKAGVEVISHANMLQWEQFRGLSDGLFENYDRFADKMLVDFPQLDSLLDAMKKANVILDATLYSNVVNKQEEGVFYAKRAHQKGVKICAGTDYIDENEKSFLYDEMEVMVKQCGFTPWEAIQSATLFGAQAIGVENIKGEVSVGFDADFVVLKDNPMESLDGLKSIVLVVKGGALSKNILSK